MALGSSLSFGPTDFIPSQDADSGAVADGGGRVGFWKFQFTVLRRRRSMVVRPQRTHGVKWAKFRRHVDVVTALLKAADGDSDGVEAAVRHYIERDDKLGASPYVLWDFFTISSPGIPELAGYCGVECEQIVAVFERLSKARFGG